MSVFSWGANVIIIQVFWALNWCNLVTVCYYKSMFMYKRLHTFHTFIGFSFSIVVYLLGVCHMHLDLPKPWQLWCPQTPHCFIVLLQCCISIGYLCCQNNCPAEIRERDWCNVVTCHMDTSDAYVWRLQNFVLGEHILSPSEDNKTPVKVKILCHLLLSPKRCLLNKILWFLIMSIHGQCWSTACRLWMVNNFLLPFFFFCFLFF